jgi:hypothetical protein
MGDASSVATAGKSTDDANLEGLQLLLAPFHAARTYARARCRIDGITLRDEASGELRHLVRETIPRCIHDYLAHPGTKGRSDFPAIDHDDFDAKRLRAERTHHGSTHLPCSADN